MPNNSFEIYIALFVQLPSIFSDLISNQSDNEIIQVIEKNLAQLAATQLSAHHRILYRSWYPMAGLRTLQKLGNPLQSQTKIIDFYRRR